jgi:hypothetical protein
MKHTHCNNYTGYAKGSPLADDQRPTVAEYLAKIPRTRVCQETGSILFRLYDLGSWHLLATVTHGRVNV